MLKTLERLLADIAHVNSKLILLVGPSRSGKTQLLRQLGAKLNIEPLNIGLELGRSLAATPNNKRGFSAGELLREIADKERTEDPLLLDNLELLFEPGLQVNPLDIVRRLAHSKRVVAVWPGELRGNRMGGRRNEKRKKEEKLQHNKRRVRYPHPLAVERDERAATISAG